MSLESATLPPASVGDKVEVSRMGQNAEWVNIGSEIPPLAVSTIEPAHTPESRVFHREAFMRIISLAGLGPKRGAGQDSEPRRTSRQRDGPP
jgi:hypothetical protein